MSHRRMYPWTRSTHPARSPPTPCPRPWARRWRGTSAAGIPTPRYQPPLFERHARSEYAAFPSFEDDPAGRKWNLWSYIDARDGAQAVRKALEAPIKGAEVFIIANADTVMTTPITELVHRFYPGVPWRREVGPLESVFSIDKARRLLGYEPQYSWRTEVAGLSAAAH